jgi:localization factor PodJL
MEKQEQDLRAAAANDGGPKAQLERIPSPLAADAPAEEAAPAVDAWLERRLRVFERALGQLEARQDKTERELIRRIALLEERLAVCENREAAPEAVPVPPSIMPEAAAALAAVVHPSVAIAEPGVAPEENPSPEKPIGDFLAHARRAANSSTPAAPHLPKVKGTPRWMAWAAVGCACAMTMTALALASVAGASETAGAVSRSQDARAFGRVIALADSGDPRDQTVVAFAYLRGQHFASDHGAAERWAMAAAERGDPMAQYLLGALYQAGDGVTADPVQAFHWFEASALRGNLKAMHNLAIAYAEGQGTDKNPERAAAWFNRAAEQGYKDSQFDLAVLYERGDGVKQNAGHALKWYLVAARAGDKEALGRAAQLEQVMTAADVAAAENQSADFIPTAHDLLANNL